MRILDRYLFRGFFPALIWCIVAFVCIAVISDVFSFIDRIVKYRIPFSSIMAFYVYYLPSLIVQVVPLSILLATIYCLSDLNRHNEIIAMKASGVSLWRIIGPLLCTSLIICVAIFIVNDRIVPKSSRIAQIIRVEELEANKLEPESQLTLKNVAIYGSGNQIIFAREYNVQNKLLSDIIVHRHDRHLNLISKLTAREGRWDGKRWIFSDVITYTIDNAGNILSEPVFQDEKIMDIEERPSDFTRREWRAEFMSYAELKKYIENFKGAGVKLLRSLEVDLHAKISFACISFIIILLSAPFALIATRGGVVVGVGFGISIGLAYYGTIAVFLALGKAGTLPPIVAAWLANILFGALGVLLLTKRS